MNDHTLEQRTPWDMIQTRWVVVISIVLFLVGLTVSALLSSVAYQAFGPKQEELPSMLRSEWKIDTQVDEVVWREGTGIPMIGTFDCSMDLPVGAAIEFSRSMQFFSEDGASLGVIGFEDGTPSRADAVCSEIPNREFKILWANIPRDFVPELPANAVIRYSARAEGYRLETAQTRVFFIQDHPESESEGP